MLRMASLLDRKLGAILGAATADAAAQPLHWNYNLDKLDGILGDREDIEFWVPSKNPFYCIETGKNSCYGDQAYAVLESMVACGGDVNERDLKERFYKMFGPQSEYANKAVDAYVMKSGVQKSYPVKGPWKHASIKHFLKNFEAGKEVAGSETDTQIDGVTKVAAVVARFAGQPEMLEKVEDMVRVTQDTDVAVAISLAAARLLELYILNGPDENAVQKVIDQLGDPNRKNPQELDTAVIGHLRKVLEVKNQPHRQVTTEVFKNS